MRRVSALTLILAVALLVLGCATGPLPPAKALQPNDLKQLSGNWVWSARFQTPARLGSGPIRVRVAGGQMLFESSAAVGALTLHEDATKRVLAGEGRDKSGDRRFNVELTQRTSDRRPDGTYGGPGTWFALVLGD